MLMYRVITWITSIFQILLLAEVLLSWIRPQENRWTTLVHRLTEPVLGPVRRLLQRVIPTQYQVIDFSPLVVWLGIGLVRNILLSLLVW